MIKFDDLIQVIASHQAIYVINKSYENKGDVDFCSANCGEIYTHTAMMKTSLIDTQDI